MRAQQLPHWAQRRRTLETAIGNGRDPKLIARTAIELIRQDDANKILSSVEDKFKMRNVAEIPACLNGKLSLARFFQWSI